MVMEWINRAIRQASVLALICALILAPVIIAVTHGPGILTDGAASMELLLHGHSHDAPEPEQSGIPHDAADHEHQTQVVLPENSDSLVLFSDLQLGMAEISAASLPPAELRRPPRALSV